MDKSEFDYYMGMIEIATLASLNLSARLPTPKEDDPEEYHDIYRLVQQIITRTFAIVQLKREMEFNDDAR